MKLILLPFCEQTKKELICILLLTALLTQSSVRKKVNEHIIFIYVKLK